MKIDVTKMDGRDAGDEYMAVGMYNILGPRDWHRTCEAAVAHAEKMRAKKLASIDKQRKKIADMVIA